MTSSLGVPSDYDLIISCGSSYTDLVVINPNHESTPLFINSTHLTAYVLIRIKDFNMRQEKDTNLETPAEHKGNPTSSYFVGKNRKFSMTFQGRFRKPWIGDEIVFGVDSDATLKPILGSKIPNKGVSLALRICKWLDPALEADLSGDCPHLYSPIVSSMNALAIYPCGPGELAIKNRDDLIGMPKQVYPSKSPTVSGSLSSILPSLRNLSSTHSVASFSPIAEKRDSPIHDKLKELALTQPPLPQSPVAEIEFIPDPSYPHLVTCTTPALDIKAWAFASTTVPEQTELLFLDVKDAKASTYELRKKLFASKQHRLRTEITEDRIYCMEFFDAYFDLQNFAVKIPGFSMSAFKYWDGKQVLRYVMRSRGGDVLMVVQFEFSRRLEAEGVEKK